MSTAQMSFDDNSIITSVEPIFISHYKDQVGASPTLAELKQYLVSLTSDTLVAILKNSDSAAFKTMPAKELLVIIHTYIRKLRVW